MVASFHARHACAYTVETGNGRAIKTRLDDDGKNSSVPSVTPGVRRAKKKAPTMSPLIAYGPLVCMLLMISVMAYVAVSVSRGHTPSFWKDRRTPQEIIKDKAERERRKAELAADRAAAMSEEAAMLMQNRQRRHAERRDRRSRQESMFQEMEGSGAGEQAIPAPAPGEGGEAGEGGRRREEPIHLSTTGKPDKPPKQQQQEEEEEPEPIGLPPPEQEQQEGQEGQEGPAGVEQRLEQRLEQREEFRGEAEERRREEEQRRKIEVSSLVLNF